MSKIPEKEQTTEKEQNTKGKCVFCGAATDNYLCDVHKSKQAIRL